MPESPSGCSQDRAYFRVTSNCLTPLQIAEFQAARRFEVDENSYGYAWMTASEVNRLLELMHAEIEKLKAGHE